jgi:predicted nuclease of predicted toxin-antitoxin system
VAGLGVRLFTDEMVSPDVAEQLERHSYDALSCQAARRLGLGDEEQLAYATAEGRAIVSFNARDFIPLDAQWKADGRPHAGIIITTAEMDTGRLVRWLARHLDTVAPPLQDNTLLWLNRAP